MSAVLQELTSRLRMSALSNARWLGWHDSENGVPYRCHQVCGDDAEMRAEYDAGVREAEWDCAMLLAADPYVHASMKGVFVTLQDGVISDGRVAMKMGGAS